MIWPFQDGKSLLPRGCCTKKGQLASEYAGPPQGRLTKRFSICIFRPDEIHIFRCWHHRSLISSPRNLWKWSNLPSIFFKDWNHQLSLQPFLPDAFSGTCTQATCSSMRSTVQPSRWCNGLLCFDFVASGNDALWVAREWSWQKGGGILF